MKFNIKYITVICSVLTLGACVSIPNGPSRMALPGSGKSFDQFQYDDASCRGFAQTQIGGKTAQQASNESFVETAVLGTAIILFFLKLVMNIRTSKEEEIQGIDIVEHGEKAYHHSV